MEYYKTGFDFQLKQLESITQERDLLLREKETYIKGSLEKQVENQEQDQLIQQLQNRNQELLNTIAQQNIRIEQMREQLERGEAQYIEVYTDYNNEWNEVERLAKKGNYYL